MLTAFTLRILFIIGLIVSTLGFVDAQPPPRGMVCEKEAQCAKCSADGGNEDYTHICFVLTPKNFKQCKDSPSGDCTHGLATACEGSSWQVKRGFSIDCAQDLEDPSTLEGWQNRNVTCRVSYSACQLGE